MLSMNYLIMDADEYNMSNLEEVFDPVHMLSGCKLQNALALGPGILFLTLS